MRVARPGGQILLLEHVRVTEPVVGTAMDVLDPLVMRVTGTHINHHTAKNVRKTGLDIERIEELAPGGPVKLMVAHTSQH